MGWAALKLLLALWEMTRRTHRTDLQGGRGCPRPGVSGAAGSVCCFLVQVTLFAYSDLLLFTKEDEPGRCSVLRNPLYLQSVKLQEGRQCPGRASATALGSKMPSLGAPREPGCQQWVL